MSPRDPDAQVEALAQRIVDVINAAGTDLRPGLRQYALDLVRDGTEAGELQAAATGRERAHRGDTNPLALAILLGLFSLPMLLLFFPVGLTLLAIATVLGTWGVVAMAVRR